MADARNIASELGRYINKKTVYGRNSEVHDRVVLAPSIPNYVMNDH